MKAAACLLLVLGVAALNEGRRIEFENKRGETVWVGAQSFPGKETPNGGGWELRRGALMNIDVDDSWGGRFWGRTDCSFDGYGRGSCRTADCGSQLKCNGTGGLPPVTHVEVTLGGWGGQDYYDITLVDGFNLPVTIQPIDKRGGGDHFRCNPASCPKDINARCPRKLRSDGGCKSACLAFNTDQYCCRGAYNNPQACKATAWPRNYPAFFRGLCPDAYTYAYDDQKSTFTCDNTAYKITFS